MKSNAVAADPTIFFLGLFGSPNLGNEATLSAFLHHVRARLPKARFMCIAPRQSNAETLYGTRLLPLDPMPIETYFWRVKPYKVREKLFGLAYRASEYWRVGRAEEMLDEADVLVVPGTGVVDDFGQDRLGMPSHLNRWTDAAQRRGVPVAFFGIGVSTVQDEISRNLFRRSLARADRCSFRDKISQVNARTLGYEGTSSVVPDLAFSLPVQSLPPIKPANGARRVVGLGVMGYFGWNVEPVEGQSIYERYLGKLVILIETLLREGVDVHLLSGDTRADGATIKAVLQRCAQLSGRNGATLTAPKIDNFQDALQAIASCDVVAATRFHNVLFSLLLERPVVSIGYSDKNDALMAEYGVQGFSHAIETFNPATVLEQLRTLLTAPMPWFGDLRDRLAFARARLASHYDDVCSAWPGVNVRLNVANAAACPVD